VREVGPHDAFVAVVPVVVLHAVVVREVRLPVHVEAAAIGFDCFVRGGLLWRSRRS
jgi:hypothetical protein